jgi:hypothetical protein
MKLKIDYQTSVEIDVTIDEVVEIACAMSLDFNLTADPFIAKLFTEQTGLDASCILKIHDLEMPKGDFVVNEHSSGFEIEHVASGEALWLSDGVDELSYFYNYPDQVKMVAKSVTLSPGVFGFVQLWTESLNEDASTTYEAYFPELNHE